MEETTGIDSRSSEAARAAMLPGAVAQAVVEALGRFMPGGALEERSRSAELGSLVKALSSARAGFGTIEKSRQATVSPKDKPNVKYTYEYATLSDAIAATAPALAEQELVIFQDFDQSPTEIVIVTELHHASGQWRRSRLAMPVARDAGPQGIGSAITYGRRYSYLALLNLAPADDDDGAAAQHHRSGGGDRESSGSDGGSFSAEDATKLAATDPRAAFQAGRQLIASVMGCGDISEPRLKRLYVLADREKGWTREQVDAATEQLLGVKPAGIPWKAYEVVVALFSSVTSDSLRAKPATAPAPAPSAQPAAAPPPATSAPPPADEVLSWGEVWNRIRLDYDSLPPEVQAENIDPKSLPAVLESFAKKGWAPEQVEAVLLAELLIRPEQMPRDGTAPPVFRKIARAFREYQPSGLTAAEIARYGWEPATVDISETLARLASATVVDTAQGGWALVKGVLDDLRAQAPEALAAMSPDDRLVLFKRGLNGGRSSGDVDALCQHYLQVRVEALPALLFDTVLRLLGAFPVRASGREEVLAVLPGPGSKLKPTELRDLLNSLIQRGALTEEEVPRSGERGTATKEDMVRAIELVRERALSEAGHV